MDQDINFSLSDPEGLGGDHQHSRETIEAEGDETCFLFNLSQNLRFNTEPNRPFYMRVDNHQI